MNYFLFGALVLIILAGIIILKINKNKKDDFDPENENQNEPDFEKDFFVRIENGEKSMLLMTLGSKQDCMLLRSILYADGIPTHAEGEHMNNVYGGITGTMTAVVAIKLFVPENDFERAADIVKNTKVTDSDSMEIKENQ